MGRKLTAFAVLLAVVAAAACCRTNVAGTGNEAAREAAGKTGKTFLFSNPEDCEKWVHITSGPGNEFIDGVARMSAGRGRSFLLNTTPQDADIAVEVKAANESGPALAWILLRWKDANNFYEVVLKKGQVEVWHKHKGAYVPILRRLGVELGDGGVVHVFKAQIEGSVPVITVWLDGQLLWSGKEETGLEPTGGRYVALETELSTVIVHSVSILRPGGTGAAQEAQEPQAPQVTIRGNVLCDRTCIPVPWDQTSQDASHIPVIFAFEGTAEVAAQLDEIMNKYYPEKGLDVEEAQKFLDEFSLRLKYYIAPGPLTDKIHKEAEWGSQILALTGVLSEKDGRKWIAVTKYESATIAYPARMLTPDKPFVTPDKEPLVLKVSDTATLKCVPVPAGRFLQGSPFYQQRYQDEFPHEVVLTKPFYMSEIPVTQEMFEAVTDRNPSVDKGAQMPVEMAAYADITEFCRILSERNGRKVRVPTDAEWEYAARVGTSNPCFTLKYKDQISEAGIKGGSTPVKTMKPNAWGLYDMLCGGWHITSSYKADNARAKEIDPQGPPRGDSSIQTGDAGPMHKSRGGYHYDFIRPNMHGAAGEDGGLWEGGTSIFRVVVEAETPATEE